MKNHPSIWPWSLNGKFLGKIAKAKGNQETYSDYVNKAYVIAMEAALRSQIELSDADPLKAIYLRVLVD